MPVSQPSTGALYQGVAVRSAQVLLSPVMLAVDTDLTCLSAMLMPKVQPWQTYRIKFHHLHGITSRQRTHFNCK